MLGILIVLCGLFGLVVGSFLNVVIYRVPRGESVVSPRSACPSCGTQLLERDNVPVVSWLLLRGRCRHCHAPISAQYPLVELACAALFAGTAARFGYDWALPAFLVLFAGLLALSVIDVERLLLPKAIVWPLSLAVAALLVVAAAATGEWHDLLVGVSVRCGLVRGLLRHVLRQPEADRIRRREARAGARPVARLAGLALRRLGILRSEPHRRRHRNRPHRQPPDVAGSSRSPTASSLRWAAPSPSSPARSYSAPSRRPEPSRGALQRTISMRSPCSSHSGS